MTDVDPQNSNPFFGGPTVWSGNTTVRFCYRNCDSTRFVAIGMRDDIIVATAAGLLSYGVADRQGLINAGTPRESDRFKFNQKLEGVPGTICDLLFYQDVEGSPQQQQHSQPGGKSRRYCFRRRMLHFYSSFVIQLFPSHTEMV